MAIKHFIAGQFTPSHSDSLLDVCNPATASVYAQCPAGHADDVEDAVKAASAAFGAWSACKPSERARWLYALADGIQVRFEDFVRCESQDTGKPVHLVRDIEIPRAIENFRFFAAACQQSLDHAYHAEAGLNYTVHQPLGVVGVISPWNLPLYLLSWKIAPALAAGNCVIAKPSEVTPMSASLLAEVCIQAGLPAGILNIVHGLGDTVGQALVEHTRVRAISFTGSTRVGRGIALKCAASFKKVTLEMGGKNPAIVFADAPSRDLMAHIARLAFQNSGQICLCGSRILVQSSIYDDFKAQFIRHIESLAIGDPNDPATRMGPMMSKAHFDKVLAYIELAKSEGGQVVTGGAVKLSGALQDGWFIAPTVIEGLPMSSRFCQEEVFGPVISLHAFESESDALAMANDSGYGLAASVWTADIARAQRMALGLETGIVWINTWMQRDLRTPFGGMKQSGLGREGGLEALKFFSEAKTVSIGTPDV